jgi:hypothetical protein
MHFDGQIAGRERRVAQGVVADSFGQVLPGQRSTCGALDFQRKFNRLSQRRQWSIVAGCHRIPIP